MKRLNYWGENILRCRLFEFIVNVGLILERVGFENRVRMAFGKSITETKLISDTYADSVRPAILLRQGYAELVLRVFSSSIALATDDPPST